jgi:hypothetical protein
MKGSSSLTSCRLLILSSLHSPLIWAQLTLLVPALGVRSPLPQNGAPIHRVRAHSLIGMRNTPLARIRWIHARGLSWSSPLLWPHSDIHYFFFFLWHGYSNCSCLFSCLLPRDHFFIPHYHLWLPLSSLGRLRRGPLGTPPCLCDSSLLLIWLLWLPCCQRGHFYGPGFFLLCWPWHLH